ncbi:uncharacterized protein LOC126681707 [Mercurialis annua]|uniref:uncharacterized protein LOC126681707 n=1 Tax=Mercurialis annua TaxID=3986 RepID=UPI0021610469|nr:uncharacterized protein LOC126681707 [Mercurialis annua]
MAPLIIVGFAVFQSNKSNNGKYLQNVREGKLRNYIKCNGDDIFDHLSKFRVERSKSNNNLVSIRCCYSNKYLRRVSEESTFIVAAADAVDENPSNWSCTLFRPLPIDDETYRFQHVQNRNNLCHWVSPGNEYDGCLAARLSSKDEHGWDRFTIIDWESLVILPKHVAIKGYNGKYLVYRSGFRDELMEFAVTDIGYHKVGE